MKLSLVPILALVAALPALALGPKPAELPAPTFYSGPPIEAREVEEDNQGVFTGTVKADLLNYRPCPSIDNCKSVGQYRKGTRITIECFTRDNTTVVNGDAGWAKLDNSYWVALSNGDYVTWTGGIPYCTEPPPSPVGL